MSKIVFIEPKAPNLHIYSQFALPRLGCYILGTMMRRRGWDVDIIFEETEPVHPSDSLDLPRLTPGDGECFLDIRQPASLQERRHSRADDIGLSQVKISDVCVKRLEITSMIAAHGVEVQESGSRNLLRPSLAPEVLDQSLELVRLPLQPENAE